ncbi:endothelin-converting enzyme-like 1 [Dermacentor albipictus]|uniref:endothelin-converting enzyme-like 1 n=1 Tax=Dermacentor albipictus TaxID=60249 RepID=UPI0038FCEC12
MPPQKSPRPPSRPARHRKHHRHESRNHSGDHGGEEAAANEPQAAKKLHLTKSPTGTGPSLPTSPLAHDLRSQSDSRAAPSPLSPSPAKKNEEKPHKAKNKATAFIRKGFAGLGGIGGRKVKTKDVEEDIELPGFRGIPTSFLVFLLIVVLLVVGVLLVGLANLFRAATRSNTPEPYNCSSGSCLAYGRFLLEGVRDDVRPCDDFYKHVCGKWDANRVGSFMDYARDRFYRAVVRAARATMVPRVGQTPAHKAAQFFQSCDDVLYRDQLGEARVALNKCGIAWPQDGSDPDLLDALLCASTKLFLSAVLHVELVGEGAGPTKLHLRRADGFDALAEKQAQLVKLGQFQRYFATLRSNFASQSVSLASVENVAHWEQTITPTLRRSSDDAETVSVPLEELESVTRGITGRPWRVVLERHLTDASSSKRVTVMIFGRSFVDAFWNLTRSFGERVMHRYVSWYAVQDIAKYANLELAINYHGSEEVARRRHTIHCARLTETLVGVPFAVPHLQKSLPKAAAQTIASMAQILALVTDEHLNTNRAMRSRGAEAAVVLSHTDELFGDNATGPLVFHSSGGALENTEDLSETFLSNWILANGARQSNTKEDTTLSVQINFNMPALASSRFHGKTVSLRPWFILPPVFTPGSPSGLHYGGLGGELVSALVSFDGSDRELSTSMPRGDSKLTSNEKTQRTNSATHLFTIGVLTSALDSSLSGNASAKEDYERLFVQLCYMRCGSLQGTDMCNRSVMRTAVFSRVFACSVESNVNHTNSPNFHSFGGNKTTVNAE